MNKYTLNFKDKEIESSYQNITQKNFRVFTLTIMTLGLLAVAITKIIESILLKEYQTIYKYCLFICYLIIQYCIMKKHTKYIRFAIILLNHLISVFFSLQVSEVDDSYNSFLRGSNVMGANFLMLISGEFLDAAISVITIGIIKIILVQVSTNFLLYSTIISSVLVIIYTIRYLYHFHILKIHNLFHYKAMRSQFLLALNDSHWEKILTSIAFKQPYLVLSFIEDIIEFTIIKLKLPISKLRLHNNMQFALKQEAQCHKFFNRLFDGSNFIRDAMYKGNKLEKFLFMQIQKYRVDRASVFNKTLVVEYFRKMIRIECSIYYGNKPTILLLMRDFLNEKKPDTSIYEQRHRNFIKLLLKVLGHIDRLSSFKCRLIERKLLILQLYEDLRLSKLRESEINVYNLAQILHNLYSHLSIKAFVSGNSNFNTISNIFLLILLIIAENSQGLQISICLTNEEENQRWLHISGNFEIEKVQYDNNNSLQLSNYKINFWLQRKHQDKYQIILI